MAHEAHLITLGLDLPAWDQKSREEEERRQSSGFRHPFHRQTPFRKMKHQGPSFPSACGRIQYFHKTTCTLCAMYNGDKGKSVKGKVWRLNPSGDAGGPIPPAGM